MPSDGLTFRGRIRNLLRSPAETKRRRSRRESLNSQKRKKERLAGQASDPLKSTRGPHGGPDSQVTLEKVLGVTASGNSGLASDPRSGAVAYPAGCVVVLLNPRNNRQQHIINASRKAITALSYSPDGKHLVTGESGHLPAVRLWDVAEQRQVAELQRHKYGVSCVAFSPNGKYIVSVGNQHDMLVNVWAWKKDVVVAANKVSSKVTGVSFSEDSSYFVTVGNRHVKFWYLDHCKTNKSGDPVPLMGRSGLLGELRNNNFCAVACGRGSKSDSAFCITSSGLLCELNHRRMLDKWVDLQTGAAQSLCVSEELVFCGCSDGTVRVFSAFDLSFICTLPRPHPLGSDISSQLISTKVDARYPDVIAVTFDPISRWVTCVHSDHSLYVWDVTDLNRVGKVHSALYHAACVWDLEMFPDVPGHLGLPSGSFVTCSADNTIRMWHLGESPRTPLQPKNSLSTDLMNVLHVDENSAAMVDSDSSTNISADKTGEGHSAETRMGIRTICVSPDGRHLASGDRNGILRVHDLSNMEEILKVEAHDAEILCLEYSKQDTGLRFLATASRDRLIHVLDADRDYGLVQTLDEHSSSITAVRFTVNDDNVKMISCGADKSIYFRTAHKTDRGTEFRRSHHSVRKSTLYDMSVDPTCRYAAVGCQDRCIRLFNISSGKQKKLFKGSLSEDGSLLKVQIDPSGRYVATSCSDKNISIVDFCSGECVATLFGHSEIVTGIKFTNDCKHLISVSGDSCIFVWRLAPELTLNMREGLRRRGEERGGPLHRDHSISREVYSGLPLGGLSSESDHDQEGNVTEEDPTVTSTDSSHEEEEELTGGSDEGQEWEPTKPEPSSPVVPEQRKRPRRRWSHRMVSLELMVKSMLDLRQLETLGHKSSPVHSRDRRSMSSLHEPAVDERARRRRAWLRSDWSSQSRSVLGAEEVPPFPEERTDSDCAVKESASRGQRRGRGSQSQDSRSPDSACSLGYDSRVSSPDHLLDDMDSLNTDSSEEEEQIRAVTVSSVAEEQAQTVTVSSVEEALRVVTEDHGPGDHSDALAHSSSICAAEQSVVPRHSMSSHFLNRGHNRRSAPVFGSRRGTEQDTHCAQPPVSKVRPLMGDGLNQSFEDLSASVTSLKSDSVVVPRAQKKTSRHVWRLSIPSPRAPSLLETASGLHKAHSVQNLTSEPPVSPVSFSDRRQSLKRPQHLFLNQSSTSPLWDTTPSPRTPHSYMNPTASSKAKVSRSCSVGEDLQVRTPPRSPIWTKPHREVGASCSLPLSSSPLLPPRASVSPCTVPPSWIPLPRQTVSPRRSLTLECSPWSAPSPPHTDTALASDKQASRRHPPPEQPAPTLHRRTSALESAEASERTAVGGRPLVDKEEEGRVSREGSQRDESITMETCQQVVTELQDCLRRTVHCYTSVVGSGADLSEEQLRMKSVLSTALLSVKTELHSLPPHCPDQSGTQGLSGERDNTSALLEQYAQLLLQSVEKKLENKA